VKFHYPAACLLIAWAFGLAGCAATRYEAPPRVAPPPPKITTDEAIAEGKKAELEAALPPGTPAPEVAPAPDPASALQAALAPVATSTRGQRLRPTDRSTEEIRGEKLNLPLDFSERLDYAHDRVYTWGQGVVENTDRRWAGKNDQIKPTPAAPFRLGLTGEAIDHSGNVKFGLDANFDIALGLPNIEKRLRIFITSDDLDEAPRSSSGSSAVRAGFRYGILKDVDFDLGVRVDIPPVAFASLKWTREISLGSWDFYPLAKLFLETKESLGYAAATTFDHWSGRTLVRSSTYAKWRLDHDRTEWSQTFIYARAQQLIIANHYNSYPAADDIGRGWGVRLLASGENAHEVTRYETGVFYRRPTSNGWLYWHAEPIVQWNKKYDWHADPGIRIGIDMLFWDLARPARR
jgi:hypothetical protein